MAMKKENWIILSNKEIYAMVKKTHSNRENKIRKIMLVLACTENGRKYNSPQNYYI